MSASSKKIKLDENCGFQAKDFTSDRAFQNHYRDHSQALFQCEKCPIKVNTRKKLSNHNFEYHSSNLTCSQCSKSFSKAVGTEAQVRKLFKAVVHTNAFNM